MTDPGKLIEIDVKPRPRVIVADDEQDIAGLIEDWLSDAYEVTVALNGKAAIQKAIWQPPDVMLCDIVMPDMGGYEVARVLQSNPQTKGVPIIVMTAKNYDDSTVQMIKAEPNVLGFINKPFKPSELIKMIQAVMAGQRTFSSTAPAAPPPSPILESRPPTVPPGPAAEDRLTARAVDRSAPSPPPPAAAPRSAPAGPMGEVLMETPPRRGTVAAGARRFVFRGTFGMLFAAAALFAAAEGVCRWTETALGGAVFLPPLRTANHPSLPYQLLPGTHWREGGIFYGVNSWGLRDRDFPLVAPPDVFRLLLLGGTTAFGPGVDEKKTLARRLEGILAAGSPGAGRTFQVINAGHWAYSPEEQLAYYEKEGFQFRPQVVVWVMERRPATAPSSRGLRNLASWYGVISDLVGRSRFLKVFLLGLARPAHPPADSDLEKLADAARTFAQANGSSLLILVPASEAVVPKDARRLNVSPDAPDLSLTVLAGRVAEAVQPFLKGGTPVDPPAPAPPVRAPPVPPGQKSKRGVN